VRLGVAGNKGKHAALRTCNKCLAAAALAVRWRALYLNPITDTTKALPA
jgi:hypothetical protein